jgi:hypothetical protein
MIVPTQANSARIWPPAGICPSRRLREFPYAPNQQKYRESDQVRGSRRSTADPVCAMTVGPRIRHVRFEELVQNPVGVVRAAYEAWNLPYPSGFEAAMNEWLAHNRSDRYGRYDCALNGLGIFANDLKDSFSTYRQRFGV